jgi:hypothetical protein
MNQPQLLLTTLASTLLLTGARAANPTVNTPPAALALASGQVAIFTVASTNTLAYEWRKDGVPLALTERVSGVAGPLLSISPALAADAGNYSVILSNADGLTPSASARLWMDVALPSGTLAPQSQTNGAGGTASFTAAAAGSEPMSYRWTRYGAPLADDGSIAGATTTNLVLPALSNAASGWYWLTASNAAGVVSGAPARLTVLTASEAGAAVDYPEGVWTAGGAGGPWVAQTNITHDGRSALRSPGIDVSSSTYIETTVFGPGELSFYWTVSSEACCDFFACQLDGVEQASISGELVPAFTQRTFAVGWGPHVVRWVFSVDQNKAGLYNAGFLDQVTFTPLPLVSLETAAAPIPLPLRTYGDAPWFGQPAINHDGQSAARCGYITHNQSTTLETTVDGPGWIAFNWKVSSEYADPLVFLVDGVVWDQIASEVDWTNRTFHLPWGLHTLSWRYQKDQNDNGGARNNAAWLDEVAFTPVALSDLAQASDLLSAPWTSGGALPWFGQNEYRFDGTDALQSGPIAHDQTSFVDTSLAGPGTLSFRWKVSSEAADALQFLRDGLEQARLAGEVDWTAVTNVVRPGAHSFRWQYTKDGTRTEGADAGWVASVSFVPAPPLPVALNAPELNWSTSGEAAWFPELVTTHDGTAAAHSGDLGDNQASTLATTVTGPGSLAYWWQVSSEYADPLIFLVDGVERARISGEVGWTNPTFNVTNGTHTLTWRYQKDSSRAVGADAGWVDQVSYTRLEPVVVRPTVTATNFSVTVATLTGWTYTLEYTDALASRADWTPVPPGVAGDGTAQVLSHTAATAGVAQRFYRVRLSQ